ncbi:RHS repeat-associated core domain-containing protein [Pseudomonas faucium]|uniref:RHS repeat-associated core domain-containing protein n=1 Tax=Pseudomonas faucium TaxID=2740518 RepID=UPI0039C3969A
MGALPSSKSVPSQKRFYRNTELVTVMGARAASSIFNAEAGDLAQIGTGEVSGSTLLLSDQMRSVMGGATAVRHEPLSYSPYGLSFPQSPILPGFNGQPREALTGWYLLGNGVRGYSPALMRFLSPDGLSPFDQGGINCYAYVSGDPVNFSDPTGHMPRRTLPNRPRTLINPANSQQQGSRNPAMNRSISSTSNSSLLSPLSTPSPPSSPGRSPQLSERPNSENAVFSSSSSSPNGNEVWKLNKSGVRWDVRGLTKVEQDNFDKFQNAIHNEGLPPWKAVLGLGGADYKVFDKSLNIYQFRLSHSQRVHFLVQEKTVIIRQVGGHS